MPQDNYYIFIKHSFITLYNNTYNYMYCYILILVNTYKYIYYYIITYYLFNLNTTAHRVEREPSGGNAKGIISARLFAHAMAIRMSYMVAHVHDYTHVPHGGTPVWLYAYAQEVCQRMAIRMMAIRIASVYIGQKRSYSSASIRTKKVLFRKMAIRMNRCSKIE